jgi:hypothetical protein
MPVTQLGAEQRALIIRFADGMLPLTGWILTPDKYTPPGPTPWRMAKKLSAADLGFPDFFQNLLTSSDADRRLADRWQWISQNPLRLNPSSTVSKWRADRGLDPNPQFGAIASGNALILDETGRQASRADFYDPFWPLITQALKAADTDAHSSNRKIDWKTFSNDLLKDRSGFWPANTPHKSSLWTKQFVKDVLYCYLDMRSPAPEPWRHAVLAELGENRRPGNFYTPAQVVQWVKNVRDLLDKKPAVPAAVELAVYIAPVGAPPIEPTKV